MLKKLLLTVVAIVALGQSLCAVDDYYKYGEWNPDGHGVSDVGGFIDNTGLLGGSNGDEYIFFREGDIGYIYRVNVIGDPNIHPDNPNATGAISPRTFTYINQFAVTHSYATGGEFYIDNTGIYYGSGRGVKAWDFNLVPQPDATNGGISSDTLAKNITTGEWWTATWNRKIYKYNNTTTTWEYQFTYPSLAGSHHDGMEIINNQLFISDMTSDKIIRYDINSTTGIVEDTSSYVEYSYTSAPYVEGMGFGPNKHFWMASGNVVYEIGKGDMIRCSQTYHYGTQWQMYASTCDNITVLGFDDTIMVALGDGELEFATADAGASNWLQSHGHTVVPQLTLSSGQAFFTLGKIDTIHKTVTNGEFSNSYVNFQDGVYHLVGFSSAIDLDAKFSGNPVDLIVYYINGSWKLWRPTIPNVNDMIPSGQGFYVLPNGNFNLLVN